MKFFTVDGERLSKHITAYGIVDGSITEKRGRHDL